VQANVIGFKQDASTKRVLIELTQDAIKDERRLESVQEGLYKLLPLTVASEITTND